MVSLARTFLLVLLVIIMALLGLGVWSYYDSTQFNVTEASVTLTTVKAKLANIFHIQTASSQPVPILMYHYIRDNVDETTDQLGYGLSVPPAEFEQQLKLLRQGGWHTVSLADVAAGKYDDKSVVLTFDDGYKDFIIEAYPLLKNYNFSATVFVITDRFNNSAHLSLEDIIYLANQGFEIGSHTQSHLNLTRQSDDTLSLELFGSRRTISNLIEKEVTVLSYPAGEYNQKVALFAQKSGYVAAVTTEAGLSIPADGLFTLKRQRVKRGLTAGEYLSLLGSF